MAAVDVGRSGTTWGVGSTIGTAVSILAGNFIPFVGTSLAITVPDLVVKFVASHWIIQTIVRMVFAQLATVTLTYGTVQALRGRKVAIDECLSQGLPRAPTALGAAILAMLGYSAGMMLLVVPGLILMLMWAVVVPAAVIERTSVTASLSRSAVLTKQRRWRILGVLLLAGLAIGVVNMVVLGVVSATIGLGFASGAGALATPDPTLLVAQWLIGGVTLSFIACLIATLYYFLRREKEGVDIDQIASVFD